MLYRSSVTERGLTGIANIFRSRLSRLDDLLGAGTVPLSSNVIGLNSAEQGHDLDWPAGQLSAEHLGRAGERARRRRRSIGAA